MAGKITYQIIADDDKAKQQVNKFFYNMEKQSEQTNKRVGKLTQQFQKLGKNLKGYAIGAGIFGGITAGARGALAVVRQMNQELERAEQLSSEQFGAVKKLMQLADNQREAKQLLRETAQTRIEQGASANQAGNFVFQAHSAGVADKRKQLAKLIQITDQGGAGQVAQGVGGLQAAFGEGKGGGTMALAGKIMSAAKYSPAGAGKMGKYGPRVAGFSAPIGATDEETLAALARTAKPIGGIEEAHTAVKAFARQLGKKGITEGGLVENVKRIQQKGMGPEQLSDYLGSSEAVQGYRQMRNVLPRIQQDVTRLQKLEGKAGTPQGYVNRRLDIMPPSMQAQIEKRRAKAAEEVGLRREKGIPQTRRQTELLKAKRNLRKQWGPRAEVLGFGALQTASFLEGGMGAEPGKYIEQTKPALESIMPAMQKANQFSPLMLEIKALRKAVDTWKNLFTENTEAQKENTEAQRENRKAQEENTEAQKENTEKQRDAERTARNADPDPVEQASR